MTGAYGAFGGRVGRVFATSEPSWQAPPAGVAGGRNVVIVLVDDLGFSDVGCYGAEIPTPNIDRLAADGIRFANYHANPMCSPTRASLLTGLNAHMAGLGHVAHSDPGFPGYAMELRDDAPTLAEQLRAAGWATLMVGKWHLCKDSNLSEAGPRHSWPLQRGFDRYYGFLDGFTNFFHPHRLYEDNHAVDIDRYPDGYYLTDDLTERAITMVDELRSSHPTKPFLLYVAHGAVHAPLQVPAELIAANRGCYDEGWDVLRRRRYERQLELGVIPPHAELPPRNAEAGHGVVAWDQLDAARRQVFARYQEIFAAMVQTVDRSVGRLRESLVARGEWENTIVLFTSDNGGSREGEDDGTSAYFRGLIDHLRPDLGLGSFAEDAARLDRLGGPTVLAHYPKGWAMVSNTPFRLYKVNTHQGGHQVPLIISGADIPVGQRGSVRFQYQHVTDILPTISDVVGCAPLTTRNGAAAPPLAGASFAAALAHPGVASTHRAQYYEMAGHRGWYRDGWSAVTCHQARTSFSTEPWELHDLVNDPTEHRDLAGEHPERLAAMVDEWDRAAWANQVFPLDEGTGLRWVQRPPWELELARPVRFLQGMPTIERYRAAALVTARSYVIDIAFSWDEGVEGVLVAHGDQGGGYVAYVEDGRIRFAYNGYGTMSELDGGPLAPGDHLVCVRVGAHERLVSDVAIEVDGELRATLDDLTMLFSMAPFEGIDVGIDRRSPVSWSLFERHGPFRYTGDIASVTYTPGELAPDAGRRWIDYLREVGARFE